MKVKNTLCSFLAFCLAVGIVFPLRADEILNNSPKLPVLNPVDPLSKEFKGSNPINFTEKTSEWPQKFSPDLPLQVEKTAPVSGTLFLLSGVADRSKTPPEQANLFSIVQVPKNVPQKNVILSQQVNYLISSVIPLHTPQLSPNANAVLIRIGFVPVDPYNPIGLLLWNFSQGQYHYVDAVGGKPYVYYPVIKWSPGGRYLSYVRGDNAFGEYIGEHYLLSVCDLTTYQDRQVLSDAALEWSWTHHGTLLCCRVKSEEASSVASRLERPSVYEFEFSNGALKKCFDGGYFAQESPDGRWIAFCDWPGKLLETNAPEEVQENAHRGLFLFDKTTGKRVWAGELELKAASTPLIQWSNDSKELFVLEQDSAVQGVKGTIYKMNIQEQELKPFLTLSLERAKDIDSGPAGFFQLRGISSGGDYLYLDKVQVISGPQGYIHTLRTLLSIETHTGQQAPVAQLMNIANENPDWDFHDDSGINPAFVAAQKIEDALPAIGEPAKK